MTLRFRISWLNASHPLLTSGGDKVSLSADGAPLTPAVSKTGLREFEIPDGTGKVELQATFEPSLPGSKGVSGMKAVVLDIKQPFNVVAGSTAVDPETLPAYGGPHPLVDTVMAVNVNGVVEARIDTTFVDVTEFWESYAAGWNEYLQEREATTPGMQLVAMGYTGGNPKIWFASITPGCTSKAKLPCLTFIRPQNDAYTRIDQPHSMFRLARYLLKPQPGATDAVLRDKFTPNPNKPSDPYIWVRCGFEDAMLRSGKALIMLHPWPSGIDFGHAKSSRLHDLARRALRFLWAALFVADNKSNVEMSRFGLAGYSGGGFSMWQGLRANFHNIDELYSFDTVGTSAQGGSVVQWYMARDEAGVTPRLRMTGGVQLNANVGVLETLQNKLQANVSGHVTVQPLTREEWDSGVNPWWDFVVEDTPQMQMDVGGWHQFVMFGGPLAIPGPSAKTYLQVYLEQSGF